MKESEYKKVVHGYDKEFNNSKEYMTNIAPAKKTWMASTLPELYVRMSERAWMTNWDLMLTMATVIWLASDSLLGLLAAKDLHKGIIAGLVVIVLTRKRS